MSKSHHHTKNCSEHKTNWLNLSSSVIQKLTIPAIQDHGRYNGSGQGD